MYYFSNLFDEKPHVLFNAGILCLNSIVVKIHWKYYVACFHFDWINYIELLV
jgi:hypothetical protein